jgi:AraC family transcriptional activator of pobA
MPATALRVPLFDLYGDPQREPEPNFMHVERVVERARVHDWTIADHRHPRFSQVLLVLSGGGTARLDGEATAIRPPWLCWVPEGLVHGFAFAPASNGYVLTIASDLLDRRLAGEAMRALGLGRERALALSLPRSGEVVGGLRHAFRAIHVEAGFAGPAARAAVLAHLDLILVGLARVGRPSAPDSTLGRAADAWRAFRREVELRYREHPSVPDLAAAIGVSADYLHDLTLRMSGLTPKSIVHQRLLLEAKRSLIYTGMTAGEIAFDLGFKDPAYFARFFARRAGCSATAYRKRGGAGGVSLPGTARRA